MSVVGKNNDSKPVEQCLPCMHVCSLTSKHAGRGTTLLFHHPAKHNIHASIWIKSNGYTFMCTTQRPSRDKHTASCRTNSTPRITQCILGFDYCCCCCCCCLLALRLGASAPNDANFDQQLHPRLEFHVPVLRVVAMVQSMPLLRGSFRPGSLDGWMTMMNANKVTTNEGAT